MPDLRSLAALPPPRPDDAAARIARRIAPAWGFAVYGVLYAFAAILAGTAAAIAVALPLGAVVHPSKPVLAAISELAALAGFIAAWWPFVRWVKRRRTAALRVGRAGVLVTGTVAARAGDRAVQLALALIRIRIRWSRVVFAHDGVEHRLLVAFTRPRPDGARCELVFVPDAAYALVLEDRGGIPCRVRAVSQYGVPSLRV